MAALSLCLPACISYETDDTRSQINNPYTTTLFAEIVTGQTNSEWLRDRLGVPRVLRTDGDRLLWRYDNVVVMHRSLKVLPLFEVSHTKNRQQYFYFEIENDLIVNYWTTGANG